MALRPSLQFLRPRARLIVSPASRDAFVSFYSAARSVKSRRTLPRHPTSDAHTYSTKALTDDEKRIKELQDAEALKYPRIRPDRNAISCAEFRTRYASLSLKESRDSDTVTLRGRLHSSRIAGSKLVFLDVVQDGSRVQGMLNFGKLEGAGVTTEEFKHFYHLARRGDIVEVTGTPMRTSRGELSLNASKLPTILSPSIAALPLTLDDPETKGKLRHVDTLVNPRVADTLKLRSHIIQYLREFLLKDNFLEVQTPIIADEAGGATARPFNTVATEFSSRKLSLRIAPELWLKRLILGGMDRVFEIGAAFRNEGLDATHNPEFTSCEFYKSFADIEELIGMTESLMSGLVAHVNHLIETKFTSLTPLDAAMYAGPYKRIEFIPALQDAIGHPLPDLEAPDAGNQIIQLFKALNLPLPHSPTLPRLLDELASFYLEPTFTAPTFLMHHPSCMAPLSKSFPCPSTHQLVSARVELFINKKEIANMYEEENSPFEQERKFVQQLEWKDGENEAIVDRKYVEALKWALPPTGGWGMGVDRLCMMMSGATRIGDVLAFGSLRAVVGFGNEREEVKKEGGGKK